MKGGNSWAQLLPLVSLAALLWLAWPSDPGVVNGRDGGSIVGLEVVVEPAPPVFPPALPVRKEAPEAKSSAGGSSWWEGKEDLRRKIARNRYFEPLEPDDTSGESEEERLAKRREFVFDEFLGWLRRYERESDPAERAALTREGVVRAMIRQRELRAMQVGDAGEVKDFAIPAKLRDAMPEEVRAIVMGE